MGIVIAGFVEACLEGGFSRGFISFEAVPADFGNAVREGVFEKSECERCGNAALTEFAGGLDANFTGLSALYSERHHAASSFP